MYCSNCGSKNEEHAKFCIRCGTPLNQSAAVRVPAATPVYAQPAAAIAPAPMEQRDGTGKYILKRLIFFGIALVLGILLSVLLFSRKSYSFAPSAPVPMVFSRLGYTLILVLVPLILAFAVGMLGGLAKGNGAKNVVRIIAAVLRSLVPFAFGFVLIYLIAIEGRLLPLYGVQSGLSYILPILALFIPLAGCFLDAAADNGHPSGFQYGVAAVAAFAANKMPVIVLAEVIVERIFSIPGIGVLTLNMVMSRANNMISVMIIYVVLIYVLRFLFDVISAAAAKGDPAPRSFAKVQGQKALNGLMLTGIILAGIIILMAIILPFTASRDYVQMNIGASYLAPGEMGYVLGTDGLGRDLYAQLTTGLRNTVIMAITNTIIAVIIGAGFGILMGFLKGAAAEVFKGITYVFGHGTIYALMLVLVMSSAGVMSFMIVGLFGWGGIAEHVAGAVKEAKRSGRAKTALISPALGQVVQTFCSAAIWISGIEVLGLVYTRPSFPTLGYQIGSSINAIGMRPHAILLTTAVLMILLIFFHVLQAGFSSREVYSGK